MNNKNAKITNEQIDVMVKSGFSIAQIGKIYGISRQAVHLRVNKEKYKTYIKQHKHYEIIFLYKIGFNIKEITAYTKTTRIYPILDKYKVKMRTTTKRRSNRAKRILKKIRNTTKNNA